MRNDYPISIFVDATAEFIPKLGKKNKSKEGRLI